jgi:hypothetical protein
MNETLKTVDNIFNSFKTFLTQQGKRVLVDTEYCKTFHSAHKDCSGCEGFEGCEGLRFLASYNLTKLRDNGGL